MLQWFDKLDSNKKALAALAGTAGITMTGTVFIMQLIATPLDRLIRVEQEQAETAAEVAAVARWRDTHMEFVRDSVTSVLRNIEREIRISNCYQESQFAHAPASPPADVLRRCANTR